MNKKNKNQYKLNQIISLKISLVVVYVRSNSMKSSILISLKIQDIKFIQWNSDTNDYDYEYFPGHSKAQGRTKRVGMVKKFFTIEQAAKKENYLILMHDVQSHTIKKIVPWNLMNAQLDKYKFVTIAECLSDVSGAYVSYSTCNSIVFNLDNSTGNSSNANTITNSIMLPILLLNIQS